MSKRSRHSDNSKRQQPVQQQRAEARQAAIGAASAKGADTRGNAGERKSGRDSTRH